MQKRQCMLFSPNGLSPPFPSKLKINGEVIERIGLRFPTKSFKLVGINLDDNLKWGEHVNKVRSKLASTAYAIARIKNTVPKEIKLQTYNSLFKCHLEYCLPVLGGCSKSNVRSISKLQKQVVRNISSSKYNSHTDPIFRKLKILKFPDLYEFSSAIFMFQTALKMHPPSIVNIFPRAVNFDRNLDFQLKYFSNAGLMNQLHSTLVSKWNKLSPGIKGWLKEYPENFSKKKTTFSQPSKVTNTNFSLNKFRLKSCKKALLDYFIYNYSSVVSCNNKYCSDCT